MPCSNLPFRFVQDIFQIYQPTNLNQNPLSNGVNGILFFGITIPVVTLLLTAPAREQNRLLKSQNEQFRKALDEITANHQISEEVSEKIFSLANNLNVSASQQANGSKEQVTAITEISSAVSELANTARNIADSAEQVNAANETVVGISEQVAVSNELSYLQSEKGLVAINHILDTGKAVGQLYQDLVASMDNLTAKSTDMRQILNLLATIANETHLLALNAAIEAAGAGEFGDRFRVVAQEVKNLANRSNKSSQQVVEIVRELENNLQSSAYFAREGYSKALGMEKIAVETGTIIQDMQSASKQALEQARLIREAAKEAQESSQVIKISTQQQRTASQQVQLSLNGLSTVAQQNASASYIVLVSATELEKTSHKLTSVLEN
jgi:methyl-accepting chemotaxis protein